MPDEITAPYPEPSPTSTFEARAVVVYGQPACVQCDRTKAWLQRKDIDFTEVDITTDPAAHRFVTEVLGYRQAPVVIVEDPAAGPGQESGIHWSGYRPDRLGGGWLSVLQAAIGAAEDALIAHAVEHHMHAICSRQARIAVEAAAPYLTKEK